MRIAIATILFSLVTLQITFAQTPNQKADEQSVRDAESSLLRAENENSKDLFACLLSADFHGLTPDGRTFDKSQALNEAAERASMHFPYKVRKSGMRIFVFGDTAVAAYTKEFVGTEGEVAGKTQTQGFVDVFTRHDSGWKLCFTKAEPSKTSQ